MKSEIDLSKQYLNENKISTRQGLWNKIIEQDEKIKELENLVIKDKDEIYRKNDQIQELEESIKMLEGIRSHDFGAFLKEIIKLQQSQNQKAIKVLEEIFQLFDFYRDDECEQLVAPKEDEEIYFVDYLKDQLNKLKGAK